MNIKKGLLTGLAAIGLSFSAQASNINVGGVVWDPDSNFDFFSNMFLTETVVPGIGGSLEGFGQVNILNHFAPNAAAFCPGCELTFEFGGFELISTNGNDFAFDHGYINFYVDHTPDFDLSNAPDGGLSSATDGDLWLSLSAVNFWNETRGLQGTLFGTLDAGSAGIGSGDEQGAGNGYLAVTGGLAASNFDTNTFGGLFVDNTETATIEGLIDFTFTSSFQPNVAGVGLGLLGSAEMRGDSIPEPSSIALLGLGLLGFAAARKKKA